MSQLNIQERLPGIGVAPPVAWAIQIPPGSLEMTVWQADGDPSTYQLIRWNSDLAIWLPVDGAFITLDSRSVLGGVKQLTWPVNATGYYAIWRSNGNGRSSGAISAASGAGLAVSVTLAGDVTGDSGATTVGKLQGRTMSATAPTDGQILRWDAGTSSWKPATPTASGNQILWFGDVVQTPRSLAALPAGSWVRLAFAGDYGDPGGDYTHGGTREVVIKNDGTAYIGGVSSVVDHFIVSATAGVITFYMDIGGGWSRPGLAELIRMGG